MGDSNCGKKYSTQEIRERVAKISSIEKKSDTPPKSDCNRRKLLSLLKSSPNDGDAALEKTKSSLQASTGGGRGKFLQMLRKKDSLSVEVTTDHLKQLTVNEENGTNGVHLQPNDETSYQTIGYDEEEAFEPKYGEKGESVGGISNFVKLNITADRGVFEYEVRYSPNFHGEKVRYSLLMQHSDIIGATRTFDGTTLYLPARLRDEVTNLTSVDRKNGSNVAVTVVFKKRKKLSECRQFYGTLFDRVMKELKFVRFGTKFFDSSSAKPIPQHKLEVWSGYFTAVDEYKGGVMVCVDIAHRILSQETVLDKIRDAYRTSRGSVDEFQNSIKSKIIGTTVLTRYNNKTYRIDDIDFDMNPYTTFHQKSGEISFVDYYKDHYGIEIKDLKQPLLIHRREFTVPGTQEKQCNRTFAIVPELSYCIGLTDEIRGNFTIMRDLAAHTQMAPAQRVESLARFIKGIKSTTATREILANWGLSLDDNAVPINYRQLKEENVMFANQKTFPVGRSAEFGRHATNTELLNAIHLTNWLVVVTRKDEKTAKDFVGIVQQNSKPMGIFVSDPHVITLPDDRTETWANALRNNLSAQLQIVVCICSAMRDDRYSVIKKICRCESPIPSQVVMVRTLGNQTKKRAIVQKIIMQMNCKIGGSLWKMHIPLKNTMICGIDTYHEKGSQSVSAFVASINGSFTKWYSKAIIQSRNEELSHGLTNALNKAFQSYASYNNRLPERIIIYRDGVADGQLDMCKLYELPQMKESCKMVDPEFKPNFTYIVIQKRVNVRFYANAPTGAQNPLPGAVLDHTVTRRNLHDFYLVPQTARQGTVTPTHYVVVEDESDFGPDILQSLSYKLCFMYYNFTSTVRVPACCQYAHKLATLVGQSIKRETSERLAEQLHFL